MHYIVSRQNGVAVDNAGQTGNSTGIVQWPLNNGINQRWNFTQNADTSWNIVSQMSWKAMDVPGGSAADGLQMVQWPTTRDTNQRWWVDQQPDGSYKIWSQATSKALDNSSSNVNGYKLSRWPWNNGIQQHWDLQ